MLILVFVQDLNDLFRHAPKHECAFASNSLFNSLYRKGCVIFVGNFRPWKTPVYLIMDLLKTWKPGMTHCTAPGTISYSLLDFLFNHKGHKGFPQGSQSVVIQTFVSLPIVVGGDAIRFGVRCYSRGANKWQLYFSNPFYFKIIPTLTSQMLPSHSKTSQFLDFQTFRTPLAGTPTNAKKVHKRMKNNALWTLWKPFVPLVVKFFTPCV